MAADTTSGPLEPALPLDASRSVFQRAQRFLPGGTTRVTVQRDPVPVYLASGEGAWLTDVYGNRYLDLQTSCVSRTVPPHGIDRLAGVDLQSGPSNFLQYHPKLDARCCAQSSIRFHEGTPDFSFASLAAAGWRADHRRPAASGGCVNPGRDCCISPRPGIPEEAWTMP